MRTALLLAAMLLGPPPGETSEAAPGGRGARSEARQQLRTYLTRPVLRSGRFLDHGVVEVAAAGGAPSYYRLEASIGVLDHLALGVTAHWLPGQSVPGWSPVVALAFWRAKWWEIGATYRALLHPPPGSTDFEHHTHYALGSTAFGRGWFSAGFDAGVAHTRLDAVSPEAPAAEYRTAVRPAGGVHLRVGTRRWGFRLEGLAPDLSAELRFDLRFGAFELRPRGGWRGRDVP